MEAKVSPRLPEVSNLQFLALGILLSGEQPGRAIREAVARFGVRNSAAAFYQFMSRLERDGLVEGWYDQVQVGDQMVTERRYRITAAGRRSWNEMRSFHEAVQRVAGQPRSSNA
jgi:DNA-binding PadR family transcriptional regulator